jgi:hypothetical protein
VEVGAIVAGATLEVTALVPLPSVEHDSAASSLPLVGRGFRLKTPTIPNGRFQPFRGLEAAAVGRLCPLAGADAAENDATEPNPAKMTSCLQRR